MVATISLLLLSQILNRVLRFAAMKPNQTSMLIPLLIRTMFDEKLTALFPQESVQMYDLEAVIIARLSCIVPGMVVDVGYYC